MATKITDELDEEYLDSLSDSAPKREDYISQGWDGLGRFSADVKDYQNRVDEARKVRYIYDPTRSAEDNLVALHDFQAEEFERTYLPLLESMESELDDNRLLSMAKSDAQRVLDTASVQTDRQMSRFIGTPTVAQRKAIHRDVDDSITTKATTTINNARDTQVRYNESLRGDVMKMGDALINGSMDSMSTIAQNQYEREQAAKAAAEAKGGSIGGTIGGSIGTYFGGPIGGAIGSYVGSSIGRGVSG